MSDCCYGNHSFSNYRYETEIFKRGEVRILEFSFSSHSSPEILGINYVLWQDYWTKMNMRN